MRMTFAVCLFVSPVLQPLVLHCFSTNTWSITRLIIQPSLTCRTGVHQWTVHVWTVCGSGLTAVCFCSPLMWGAVRGAGPQSFHLLCLFTARFHFRFHSTPRVLCWRSLTSCHYLPPHCVIRSAEQHLTSSPSTGDFRPRPPYWRSVLFRGLFCLLSSLFMSLY